MNEQYERDQRNWIRKLKLKRGDRLKVVALPSEENWPHDPHPLNDWSEHIGKTYIYDGLPIDQHCLKLIDGEGDTEYVMPFFIFIRE